MMLAYVERWRAERGLLPKELSVCKACGAVQDMQNGLGHGSCSLCLGGILVGWSGTTGSCSYAGCDGEGVAFGARGKRFVCLEHATFQGVIAHGRRGTNFVAMDVQAPLVYHAQRWIEEHHGFLHPMDPEEVSG